MITTTGFDKGVHYCTDSEGRIYIVGIKSIKFITTKTYE